MILSSQLLFRGVTMDSDNRVSFYTDLTKHHEFLSRLQEIINHPESNIVDCYFAQSTSNRFSLFIDTKNPRYSFKSIVFDFSNPFWRDSWGDADSTYLEDGLSQVDIDNLKPFLADFTFKNSYEGLFFASVFFGEVFNPKKASTIYLKFTPDVKKNKYIVDGKHCELQLAVTSRENLVYELERERNKKHAGLYKCSTYSFQHHKEMKYCINQINKVSGHVPKPDWYVVEFYHDLEHLGSYINTVYKVVDEQLVKVDIEDFLTQK